MYPNLYYAFRDLFGVELPGLRFINSFGFFVAFAFLAAAYVLTRELKRKERAGLMSFSERKIMVGKPASATDLLTRAFFGFLLGYKILGLFFADRTETEDPQEFIFSAQGSWPAGIITALIFTGIEWFEKNRHKLAKPEERMVRIWPHDRVGDMVVFAAIFGFLGAKVFHNLENWEDFSKNPIDALLSFSGLTFYGGLICAAVAIFFYARKHKIGFRHLCDAFAPALLLAYAIGRIGCQVSGDGDWGVPNSAYSSTPSGKIISSDSVDYAFRLKSVKDIYMKQSGYTSPEEIKYRPFKAPSWMPVWMVAYNYPNNVLNEGVPIDNCKGQYCNQLPLPVYPTPMYETIICILLTGVLLALRKRLIVPGTLFAVYLIMNGVERFFIEKIRVNTHYDIFGFRPTQAELISSALVIGGIALFIFLTRRNKQVKTA